MTSVFAGREWGRRGVCSADPLGFDGPEFFAAEAHTAPSMVERERRQITEFCRVCPVTVECRDWALSAEQFDLVAGGLTTRTLRAIKRGTRLIPGPGWLDLGRPPDVTIPKRTAKAPRRTPNRPKEDHYAA